jgi:hypothetical protein
VRRSADAARATAAGYGPEGFVTRWGEVLRTAGRQRRHLVRLTEAGVAIEKLEVKRGRLQFAGVLTLVGESRTATLESAEVTLAAIDDGVVTPIPVKAEPAEDAPRIAVRTAGGLLGGPKVPEGARLRLRVTWNNAAWETALPPDEDDQPVEDDDPDREYAAA